ncbi:MULTISPECIES: heme d1 biosynthesis radical SAM protein NirJ [Azospirillum]|uniref:Heme d1 biosynthesis radical SAM protein NirJ n=1 Tax=Azospirillum brasilense TaxID=192 RepID=A0ABU4PHK7_AZOBR|nr:MULTISPECIES: heme d1 biosynthesis radical SAM protein NirJ [Azospirillum]ALJ39446.1 heme d1 biosynthesis radical SAM protein NirJ [Azospirillum brasilense]MDX5955934.1 heme d1 biosynthesis radical SAM protein NirJ [Azospirillum brasilense]PWC82939.1 radical SAM protein [Azospirillum sp. Sp 7]
MFRLSQFMRDLVTPPEPGTRRRPPVAAGGGPVVIWNLVRRCNLSCLHCYSFSADHEFPGELTTEECLAVLDDLYVSGVRVLILSGGEPMMRPDLPRIAQRAKAMGFYVGLSTNGTLIDERRIGEVAEVGYDYVGISLDGVSETHDRFRRRKGAFEEALRGIRLCHDAELRVGIRLTLTETTARDLPALLDLMDREFIDKFYLSHLNYAGRGDVNRRADALKTTTRAVMDQLFDLALADAKSGRKREIVTGNNDADGVYLLWWAQRTFPERVPDLLARLRRWGGNASGVGVANIDTQGDVHPDTMWGHHTLGNVRARSFGAIWNDLGDPLMAVLKTRPRPVKGRCATCAHLAICNGNTRIRAEKTSGDTWAEDPGCYLTDTEVTTVPKTGAPQ